MGTSYTSALTIPLQGNGFVDHGKLLENNATIEGQSVPISTYWWTKVSSSSTNKYLNIQLLSLIYLDIYAIHEESSRNKTDSACASSDQIWLYFVHYFAVYEVLCNKIDFVKLEYCKNIYIPMNK